MTQADGQLEIHRLLATERLHAWVHFGEEVKDKSLTVVFSGIGPKGTDIQPIEFPRYATRNGTRAALFIVDPERSWLNAPNLIEDIVALINKTCDEMGATSIVLMGHSMGGFMAAVLPGFVKANVAICFSPQSSVHPEIVPQDKRWWEHRQHISDFRIRQVSDHLSDDTRYYVIFGTHPREAHQVRGFEPGPNLFLYLLPDTNHNTAPRLKAKRRLGNVIRYASEARPWKVRSVLERRLDAYTIKDVAMRDAVLAEEAKAVRASAAATQ